MSQPVFAPTPTRALALRVACQMHRALAGRYGITGVVAAQSESLAEDSIFVSSTNPSLTRMFVPRVVAGLRVEVYQEPEFGKTPQSFGETDYDRKVRGETVFYGGALLLIGGTLLSLGWLSGKAYAYAAGKDDSSGRIAKTGAVALPVVLFAGAVIAGEIRKAGL